MKAELEALARHRISRAREAIVEGDHLFVDECARVLERMIAEQ